MAFGHDRCRKCSTYGIIRIRYKTKEPDDYALCDCRMGRWFRRLGIEHLHEYVVGMGPESRIGWLEDFDDAVKPDITVSEWARR